MNANITARLVERARAYPERPAMIEWRRGRRRAFITYEQLARGIEEIAGGLRARGLRPGDRALVLVPMSVELYMVLLAILHAGGVAVFVDAWSGWRRVDAAARKLTPRLFVGSPRAQLLRIACGAVRAIPSAIIVGRSAGLPFGAAIAPEELSPGAPALVTFTTGSTGKPKAAVRTHGFLWDQHVVLSRHLGPGEGDVDMPTLPIFVLHNLAAGATSVIPDFNPKRPAEIDPQRIRDQMVAEKVVSATGSPAFFDRLLRWCEERGERLALRRAFTGGAPVMPGLAGLLAERIEGRATVVYGSTEAEPISLIDARDLVETLSLPGQQGLCVGRPVPEIELRLMRPASGEVKLGDRGWEGVACDPGETGEIVVAGPQVQTGYFDDATTDRATKIADGAKIWHRTGDGGRLDTEGRLWLMGRVSMRVRAEDKTWWSLPAELAALQGSGATHAAYFGVPRADGEERAILCLEGPPPGTGDEILPAARGWLNPYPVDLVYVLDRIPRDPRHASKTDMRALRKQLGLPAG